MKDPNEKTVDSFQVGDKANVANPSVLPVVLSSCNSELDGHVGQQPPTPVILVAQIDSQWLSSAILSMGIVAALVLFVIQSFAHPNAATVVIPLLMVPLATVIQQFMKGRKCVECPNCKTVIVANGNKELR